MNIEDILEFGKDYESVFGAEAIKKELLSPIRLTLDPFWSIFSHPLEHVNDKSSLKVEGTDNPKASDTNFRPYKAMYRAMSADYTRLK